MKLTWEEALTIDSANFHKSSAVHANFQDALIVSSLLTHCDLKGSNFRNIRGYELMFTKSNLTEASLQGAKLLASAMNWTTLDGANLQNTEVLLADFTGASMLGTSITHTDFSGSIIDDHQLENAKHNFFLHDDLELE